MAKQIICGKCGAELAKGETRCLACGEKIKKPFYRKWWVWVLVIFFGFVVVVGGSGNKNTGKQQQEERMLSTINISVKPEKVQYEVGDSLDTDGLILIATYSDGSTEQITEGYTVEGFDSSTAGDKTVTVTYGEKVCAFEVEVKESTPVTYIETVIQKRINEEYTRTEIEKIIINENLGTNQDGDYIALVYLTWNQKNSGKTSKEVLSLYSEDLAATVAKECADVQEIAIFWTVPYLNNANAKCAYERKNGAMYEMDIVWGKEFN